jgi:hypothetical protein
VASNVREVFRLQLKALAFEPARHLQGACKSEPIEPREWRCVRLMVDHATSLAEGDQVSNFVMPGGMIDVVHDQFGGLSGAGGTGMLVAFSDDWVHLAEPVGIGGAIFVMAVAGPPHTP